MRRRVRAFSRELWPLLALALPLALVASALATLSRLDELRELDLRSRAAAVAARLERLPASAEALDSLSEEEPALIEVRLFRREEAGEETARLAPLWEGRELFRTERLRLGGVEIFRAYIPVHAGQQACVARIDLAAGAADWLLEPARRNVMVAALSGLALVLLALYALWSLRRTARLERRQLELEHLARLGQMSAALAHEIRNPLGTIKGFAQLAAEKATPEAAALLAPVLDEIRRLERLVSDLLLYGRPPQPNLRWVEWDRLAGEIERAAREAASGRPIRFVLAGGGVRLKTDPDLLKAALLNLVRNAIEALEESGGEVRLEIAAPPRGAVVVAVEDDGPGLSEEARARLFEPFYTSKASGTGLGLAISKRLAEALGGELRILPAEPRGARAELVFREMEREAVAAQEPSVWKRS